MDCDSEMHGEPEEIEAGWVASKFKGGGGTDFRPPFKYCEKHNITPVCSIYLTDGECNSFPQHGPEWAHLWVLVQEPRWGGGWKPPFGETVRMDERDEKRKR